MSTIEHVAAVVYSALLGPLVVLTWAAWAQLRRVEQREWEASPLAQADKRPGWDDDPDTLRDLPVVRVPGQAVADSDTAGRHRKGAAA